MDLEVILARLRPTPEQRRTVEAKVARLVAAAQDALDAHGLAGEPSVQGSMAKDTWLAGSADVDLFLLLDPATDPDRLKQAAVQVGEQVLDDAVQKYAQHPYLVGHFEDLEVDVVPACKVADAKDLQSAVDRTPFHTAWVADNLDAAARDDVRLAKAWLKGVEVYGAETAIGGFSGYLVEVLVHHLGGFDGLVEWLAADAMPRHVGPGTEDLADAGGMVVAVVDPVDASRNCAAAIQEATLERAVRAARAFQAHPHERFFFPAPRRPEPRATLKAALADQGATWVGLEATPQTDRLDIVFPQFQRALRQVTDGFEKAGFTVLRTDVSPFADRVGFQWVVRDERLPATRVHEGPRADVEPNAGRFRAKWQDHPLRASDFRTDENGRLRVEVRIEHRTPQEWISANGLKHLTGKHVQKALAARPPLLGSPSQADEAWAPRVADVVLDRCPWER